MNNSNYENQAGALSAISERIEALEILKKIYYSEIIRDATNRVNATLIVSLANGLRETENAINELYLLQGKIRRANTEVIVCPLKKEG